MEVATVQRDTWREVYNSSAGSHLYGRIPSSWENVELSVRCGRKLVVYTDTETGEVVLIRAYTGRDSWNTADSWLKDGKLQRCNRGPQKVSDAINALAERINAGGLSAALKHYRDAYVMCCCCGAELTDPTSRLRGIGPVCDKKIGVAKLLRYLLS